MACSCIVIDKHNYENLDLLNKNLNDDPFPLSMFDNTIISVYCIQTQDERDELYKKFVKAVHEVQQKSNFKNLLLEKKLGALADTLEKKEAQLNEVLSASNLDPTALTVVTRKLEVSPV